MAVYVDDMYLYPMGRYKGMKMSHMMADTREELVDMANKIGLQVKWIQYDDFGRHRRHFDISMTYRDKAVDAGAISVTMKELGAIAKAWKEKDAV